MDFWQHTLFYSFDEILQHAHLLHGVSTDTRTMVPKTFSYGIVYKATHKSECYVQWNTLMTSPFKKSGLFSTKIFVYN
jgi:hypothetical protein